jgi:hypothetical protein
MRSTLVLATIVIAASVAASAFGDAIAPRIQGQVYVNCWHRAPGPTFSGYFVATAHPRTCTIWGSPEDLAHQNVLRRLRWHRWGQAATSMAGQVRNTHPGMGGPFWTAVTARLSRVRRGCDDYLFYTRIAFPGSDASAERLSASCEPSG